MEARNICIVFVTASNKSEARSLSQTLLKSHLAACINCIDKVESSYWWKGKIEKSYETLLLIKTEKSRVQGLIKKIKEHHSYTVPEIIACPITEGNRDYLEWVAESLKRGN